MQSLSKVNIPELLGSARPRMNFNLFWVDGAYTLRVAKVEGAFPWHFHPESDEGWIVFQGGMSIRTEDDALELGPLEATLIPKGLRHSPLALQDGSIVGIINSRTFETVYTDGEMTDEKARFRVVTLGEDEALGTA